VAFHNRQQDVSAARLWDARTGVELPPLRLFKGSPPGDIVAISPDCRKAIVSQGQAIETAFLWDLDKGEEIPCPQNSLDSPPDAGLRPPGTGERTNGTPTTNEGMKLIPLAISPDGRLAVGKSRLATPVVWEIASGKIIVSPARPCYLVRCPVFAPDSRKLFFVRLLGNERTDELWDLGRGGKQLVLEGHIGGDVVSAAFSADGRLLITGGGYSDRSVRIWDAETGKSRAIFKDLRSKIPQVALGYDGGRAVVGVEGCPLSIWDVARTEPVSVGWVPPGAPPAFSPDGKSILVAKDNSTVAALDARDGHLLSNLAVGIDLQQYGIAALAFGPARKCAVCRPVGDSKNRLLVVDLDSGRKQALPEHENGRVILSDDGHYLAVCGTVHQQSGIYVGDGSARIWDTETGEL